MFEEANQILGVSVINTSERKRDLKYLSKQGKYLLDP
jgi:hypothetical protein